jgi:hypothetical protein
VDNELAREDQLRLGSRRARRHLPHRASARRDPDRDRVRLDTVRRRDRRPAPRRRIRHELSTTLTGNSRGLPRHPLRRQRWGKFGHTFVPFSPKTNEASPADSWRAFKGETFRFVILDIHDKTVVLFFDSVDLRADQFATFLTSANRLLASLKFNA